MTDLVKAFCPEVAGRVTWRRPSVQNASLIVTLNIIRQKTNIKANFWRKKKFLVKPKSLLRRWFLMINSTFSISHLFKHLGWWRTKKKWEKKRRRLQSKFVLLAKLHVDAKPRQWSSGWCHDSMHMFTSTCIGAANLMRNADRIRNTP